MSGTVVMFARGIIRFRYLVVVAWIVATAAAMVLLPTVAETQSDSVGDLVATEADAIETEIRAREVFKFPLLSRTIVVQRDPNGLSAQALSRFATNVAALARGELPDLESIAFALPATNVLGRPPFSRESSTTALTYLFFPPEIGPVGRTGLARLYADRHLDQPGDAYVGVTGTATARAKQRALISTSLPKVELATILIVMLAVALHFRAVGAPLLNLVAVIVTYLISVRVLGGAGSAFGIGVPPEVEPVMVALLFGVVTDYSIFFLSRLRGRLSEGDEHYEAVRRTTSELLPIIAVAGLTVAAATATLVVARLGFFQAFGPGLALSVTVALAVATTFVPALLAIAGPKLYWPAGIARGGSHRGGGSLRASAGRLRAAIVGQPLRRPLATAVAITLLLGILAAGLLGLEVGNRTIEALPEGSEAKVAYRQASRGFAPGILSPTVVLVEAEGITKRRRDLARLQTEIARRPHVAQVLGPIDARAPVDYGAVFSTTGDAVRLFVVLDQDPLGSGAIKTVQSLGEDLPGLLDGAGLEDAEANLAGDTALSAETVSKSRSDLLRVVPAATLVVFAILAVFLRALVAPFYLVLASLLALAASLGLTAIVFQDLLGYGELTFFVPFAAAVLLIALGSDYNVYLVGRVWSEARRRSLREAVAVAGSRAAGAITVAGLVLAASFASLALVPLRPFQELAFAVSVGLLIDAFLVRSLLAPALITLVGERSGWPGSRLKARRSRKHPGATPADA